MLKLIKSFFKSSTLNPMDSDTNTIQKIATANSINRRKNARINYPHLGAMGPFPLVKYLDSELIIANISVGGFLVIDDIGKFGTTVGDIVNLDVEWPDYKTKMRCRVVGVVLQRRHIQFMDFNPQAFVRISQLIKPGFLGQKFHKVENPEGKLDALEMWMGPGSENLVFLDQETLAEYNAEDKKLLFPANRSPHFSGASEPLPLKEVQDLFVMFSNFPNPTARVKRLIESLERWFRVKAATQQQRTGSDG